MLSVQRVADYPTARLALLAALLFVGLSSRRPELLLRPQFWAEDGLIFFQQAHELGFLRSLIEPYAGYLHTLPRLVAGVTLLVPLIMAPLVFNLVGLVIQVLPAVYLVSGRMRDVASLGVRVLVALLFVGIPNVWRVHGNMANAQWHVAVLCCLILIAPPPRTLWTRIFDGTMLAICCVTGPFAIVLLPIAAVVAWQRRDSWTLKRGALFAAGALITMVAMQVSGARLHPRLGGLGASVAGFVNMLAFQVVAPVLWGTNPTPQLAAHPAVAVLLSYVLAGAGLVLVASAFIRGGTEVRCFLLFAALVLAASLASPLAGVKEPAWLAMQRPGATHRYWLLPELAVVVAVVTVAFTARSQVVRTVGTLLIGVMVVVEAVQWRMPPLPDLRYPQSVAAFRALPIGAQMRIPILPNWAMTLTRTARD